MTTEALARLPGQNHLGLATPGGEGLLLNLASHGFSCRASKLYKHWAVGLPNILLNSQTAQCLNLVLKCLPLLFIQGHFHSCSIKRLIIERTRIPLLEYRRMPREQTVCMLMHMRLPACAKWLPCVPRTLCTMLGRRHGEDTTTRPVPEQAAN